MTEFSHLNIGVVADDAVMDRGEIHRAERSDKTTFNRGAVNIGVRHGNGVLNDEFFGTLRIVAVVVHQGFYQIAVLDANHLIVVERYFQPFEIENVSPGLQFVPTYVSFVEDGVIDKALSQEVAPRQVGIAEMKVQRMERGQTVKTIKFQEFVKRCDVPHVRTHIKGGLAQIYVHSGDNAFNELFKLLHGVHLTQ